LWNLILHSELAILIKPLVKLPQAPALQSIDNRMPLPSPLARQIASLSCDLMICHDGLKAATRALEQGDARAGPLQREIERAVVEIRECLAQAGKSLESAL